MKIILEPLLVFDSRHHSEGLTIVRVSNKALRINGVLFDFSSLEAGDVLDSKYVDSDLITGMVLCDDDGELELRLIFFHGVDAHHEARFPEPIHVTEDGPVTLPDACWPPEPEYPEEPQPEPEDDSEER